MSLWKTNEGSIKANISTIIKKMIATVDAGETINISFVDMSENRL